jgi:hypothetical protein
VAAWRIERDGTEPDSNAKSRIFCSMAAKWTAHHYAPLQLGGVPVGRQCTQSPRRRSSSARSCGCGRM